MSRCPTEMFAGSPEAADYVSAENYSGRNHFLTMIVNLSLQADGQRLWILLNTCWFQRECDAMILALL